MSDVDLLVETVREAGEIGLKYFKKDPEVWIKGKDSPVSEADFAIDRFLREHLCVAREDYGWLSEESEDNPDRLSCKRLFVVDPIDGTRGFLQETENWMISVAVVEDGRPVCGVLYGPVMNRLYVAASGRGATCNGTAISPSTHDNLQIGDFVIPARIADNVQKNLMAKMSRARYVHSLAYRLALVADGEFAGAVARPNAHDWDIAAADIILREAGGVLAMPDGKAPLYNCEQTRHDWLIASGKNMQSSLQRAVLEAIEEED